MKAEDTESTNTAQCFANFVSTIREGARQLQSLASIQEKLGLKLQDADKIVGQLLLDSSSATREAAKTFESWALNIDLTLSAMKTLQLSVLYTQSKLSLA